MEFGNDVIASLETKHPLYDSHMRSWVQMQDCFDGEDAVKSKGTDYLPMLTGQDAYLYESYKMRAYWYGATRRVVLGSVGMLLSNEPVLYQDDKKAGDDTIRDWYDSLASDNSEFSELLKRVTQEYVLKGRVGLFVDGENLPNGKFTPKVLRYPAESIINWDYDMHSEGKSYRLKFAVLEESVFMPKDDVPWVREESTHYRVLWLDAAGIYNQAIYREIPEDTKDKEDKYGPVHINIKQEADTTKHYQLVEGSWIQPEIKGRKMDQIPFWIMNYGGDSGSLAPPPLKELADMNLSHYRTVALHENALFYCGVPTVVFTGTGGQSIDAQLGLGKAINLEEEGAGVNFLTMGESLAPLEKSLDAKELKMGLLGSRMLLPEPEKGGSESTATHRMRRKGEHSVISSMSDVISAKFSDVVRFAAEWGNRPSPEMYQVRLLKEFSTLTPDSNLIQTFMMLVEKKLLSYEAFGDILKKMEVLPPGTDLQEELAKIDSGLGSDIIAEMIKLEHAPKKEVIDVERNGSKKNRKNPKAR